ncbi:hypothetical protein [Flavobacterium sp. CAU 1735]|uniref:hypothetical protein n=1 Tax=Flavobacterium sp. CAU 1735 TaxID=3140361 RepID=UPI003260CA8B
MSDTTNFNPLYRPILSGSEYNKLIPDAPCMEFSLGNGDTGFTVTAMETWIKEHFKQLSKIAPLLKAETLQQTIANIHGWTCWHFQYVRDDAEQRLKSPACAWKTRSQGMDCKSYTIVVSSLLLNLGIKHYIRRIKQPGSDHPNEYSHVYAIVPFDQNTADLKSGYYTVDATLLLNNVEVEHTEPKDTLMDFKHTGLNGVAKYRPGKPRRGLGISLGDIKSLNFGSLFSNMSCWGGSAYESQDIQRMLPGIMAKYKKNYDEINVAVATKDMAKLSQTVAYAQAWPFAAWNKLQNIFYGKKWNVCTDDSIRYTQQIHTDMNNKVNPLLVAYLDKYFIKTPSGQKVSICTNVYTAEFATMFFSDIGAEGCHSIDSYNFMIKPGITIVPKFELPPDLINAINQGLPAPSTASSLAQMVNTAASYISPTAPPGATPTQGGNYTQDPAAGTDGVAPNTPGTDKGKGIGVWGWIAAGTALLIGGTAYYMNEKKKPKTPNTDGRK